MRGVWKGANLTDEEIAETKRAWSKDANDQPGLDLRPGHACVGLVPSRMDDQLSGTALAIFESAWREEASLIVPTIVLAELLGLSERRRPDLPLLRILDTLTREPAVTFAPLDLPVFQAMRQFSGELELHDRAIAATAVAYEAKLLTTDGKLTRAMPTVCERQMNTNIRNNRIRQAGRRREMWFTSPARRPPCYYPADVTKAQGRVGPSKRCPGPRCPITHKGPRDSRQQLHPQHRHQAVVGTAARQQEKAQGIRHDETGQIHRAGPGGAAGQPGDGAHAAPLPVGRRARPARAAAAPGQLRQADPRASSASTSTRAARTRRRHARQARRSWATTSCRFTRRRASCACSRPRTPRPSG